MADINVSVIVVSRARPQMLLRCLTGLSQLCHPSFEIVVVADTPGCAAMDQAGWGAQAKTVTFDEGNISAARNAGIAVAAGEVLAFIDDDAVPEPTWLDHLIAPFEDPGVWVTGGYVLGRNGFSFQWRGRAVNRTGDKIDLRHRSDDPFEPNPPSGYVTATEGTNCAFRRAPLTEIGGFDPAFRFYFDETDVNLRIAAGGGRTVLVPQARVHHGYAPSDRRAADRAPKDLTEIGASAAVFLRKHAPDAAPDDVFRALRDRRRTGLLQYMVEGRLEPRDVRRLLDTLAAGFKQGQERAISPCPPIGAATDAFQPFQRSPSTGISRYFAGRPWNRAALRRRAAQAVADGDIVTIFRFSPTLLPHRVQFLPEGWWEQRGGLFGPAHRSEPGFLLQSFAGRAHKEWAQTKILRQCDRGVTN